MRIGLNKIDRCRLNCFFCLTNKEEVAYSRFSYDSFVNTLDKVLSLGFDEIDLTPNMGDIFDEPDTLRKLEYLSGCIEVKKYCFATNFLSVTERDMNHIIYNSVFEKIWVDISVYGWDRESYMETTGTDNYDLFVRNLKLLISICSHLDIENPLRRINLYMRCGVPYEEFPDGEVKYLLASAVGLYGAMYENTEIDNSNWGGKIAQGKPSYKSKGICVHAIHDNGIFPDGRVTLCVCWDTFGELVFGNIHNGNPYETHEYEAMLVTHATGRYPSICRDCNDYYPASKEDLIGYKYAKKFEVLIRE